MKSIFTVFQDIENRDILDITESEITNKKKDIAPTAQEVKTALPPKAQFTQIVIAATDSQSKPKPLSSDDYKLFMAILETKFNLYGGRALDIYHQLRGSTKDTKSKRYQYGQSFRDRPVTLSELQAFVGWYPAQCKDCPYPIAADTLEDWFGKYLAQIDKQRKQVEFQQRNVKRPLNYDALEKDSA